MGTPKILTEQRGNFGCRDLTFYACDSPAKLFRTIQKEFQREFSVMPRESHSRGFGPASLLGVALILLVSAIAMLAPRKAEGTPDWELPLSVQAIATFTHTAKDMDTAGSAPYLKANNNVEFQTASLFYGGAVTDHIGVFAQATYTAQGFGPPAAHLFSWDNLDIRYANTTNIAGMPVVYGITVNNNPTVQDPWNTTPAWGFPFTASNLANTPGAKTLIDQGFAAQVLGAGAYAFINDQIYLEGAGYQTLSPGSLNSLGVNPINTLPINGVAPYFRAAIEQQWSKNIFEVGTFGLFSETGLSLANPGAGTNHFNDIGFDSQYQ